MFRAVPFCTASARQILLFSLVSVALCAASSGLAEAAVRMILGVRQSGIERVENADSAEAQEVVDFAEIVNLLHLTLPASPAELEQAAQTGLQLLYGGAVCRETVVGVGRHAVRLRALEQAARRLSAKPAARLFTDEIPRLMALCAAMHRITLGETELGAADPGSDTVRLYARWAKVRDEEPVLREHIATGQSLDFQVMAYTMMRRYAADALRLVRDAAVLRREQGDDSPQAQRLETLLAHMDSLGTYLAGPFPPDAATLAAMRAADPGNPVYLLETAAAQLRASHPASALSTLKNLDEDTADSPQALYLRGLAELALRLPGLALRNLSAAVALAPEDPAFWEARAGAYNALGDAEAMCRDLRQSCTLGLCAGFEEARRKGFCE